MKLKVWLSLLLSVVIYTFSLAEDGKLNYAVVNLKNGAGISEGEADIIADRLRVTLFETGKANMMERDQMQEILKEQGFQSSGACSDEACMVEIGQLLGVQRLISGSIGKLGSMVLVNFRTIDVQTAKIINVVSVDVDGDIEDVVGELPNIASQLVEKSNNSKKELALQDNSKNTEKDIKEEKKESEPQDKRIEKKSVDTSRKKKNANRAGIRLVFNMYPGGIENDYTGVFLKKDYYSNVVIDSTSQDYQTYYGISERLIEESPLYNAQLKFIIRAGRFIAIDVGPSLMFGHKEIAGYIDTTTYSGDTVNIEQITRYGYAVPGLALGVNFVYRIFPLKINAGLMLDPGLIILSDRKKYEGAASYYFSEHLDVDAGFALGYGIRTGAEILAGKNVGFAVDLLFRNMYSRVNVKNNQIYPSDDSSIYYDIKMYNNISQSIFGLGFSVNFYF